MKASSVLKQTNMPYSGFSSQDLVDVSAALWLYFSCCTIQYIWAII